MYSCQQTPEARMDELRRVIARETLSDCPVVRLRGKSAANELADYSVGRASDIGQQRAGEPSIENAIDYGGWLSTIIFLSVAVVFAVISAIMSLVNILFNPVEPIFRWVELS